MTKFSAYENFFSRNEVNIDIGNKCGLECPRCQRQIEFTNNGLPVRGNNLTIDQFKKVVNHFEKINFCGQLSDPIHHPQFIEFLKLTKDKKVSAHVHVASSARPKKWYIEAYKANPNAQWWFGIDGLPEESCLYRINQDGQKLFDMMLESKKYLIPKPRWQYIVFKYNQDNIEEAKKIAIENDITFHMLNSSRWRRSDDQIDPFKPDKKYRVDK